MKGKFSILILTVFAEDSTEIELMVQIPMWYFNFFYIKFLMTNKRTDFIPPSHRNF